MNKCENALLKGPAKLGSAKTCRTTVLQCPRTFCLSLFHLGAGTRIEGADRNIRRLDGAVNSAVDQFLQRIEPL